MGKISNTKILSALLSGGSIREAAKIAKCSETTVKTRLNDPEFKQRYEAEKESILTEVCDTAAASLTEAVNVLRQAMKNPQAPINAQITAADALLRHGLRYIEAGNILARLDKLEEAQAEMNQGGV